MKTCPEWVLGVALTSILVMGSAKGSTIASVKLSDLFKQADLVAAVEIVSGDAENYPVVVYKGKVLTAFKGIGENETIFFGPFVGFAVGNEYIVFLTKSKRGVKPNHDADASRGEVKSFYGIMY